MEFVGPKITVARATGVFWGAEITGARATATFGPPKKVVAAPNVAVARAPVIFLEGPKTCNTWATVMFWLPRMRQVTIR